MVTLGLSRVDDAVAAKHPVRGGLACGPGPVKPLRAGQEAGGVGVSSPGEKREGPGGRRAEGKEAGGKGGPVKEAGPGTERPVPPHTPPSGPRGVCRLPVQRLPEGHTHLRHRHRRCPRPADAAAPEAPVPLAVERAGGHGLRLPGQLWSDTGGDAEMQQPLALPGDRAAPQRHRYTPLGDTQRGGAGWGAKIQRNSGDTAYPAWPSLHPDQKGLSLGRWPQRHSCHWEPRALSSGCP